MRFLPSVVATCLALVSVAVLRPDPVYTQGLPPSPYALGSGDVLEISVWGDEALTRQVLVRPDGGISFPLIGDLPAAGKTVDELRQEIWEKMKEYIPEAPVAVVLLENASRKVYVLGKVNRPGEFLMHGPVTILQALAMAGGMNTFADEDEIQVVRMGSDGSQSAFEFNYSKVSTGRELETNIVLQPGDTVVVP